MFDGLIAFGHSILGFMNPASIAFALAASFVGFVIGALPGLTATMGVALMTTLTIKLPPNDALLILICTYVGAIYGGSRSAILLNIPGTPASAASCLDGHALARQGLAGRAMGIATSGSVLGTWIGMVALALFTPVLGEMALKFGAYEFFWLAVFGVVISGNLTGDDPLKGWMAGFLGLFIAGIGQEALYAYNRFTFGIHDLSGGISLVPALVGAFGLAEVLTVMKDPPRAVRVSALDAVIPKIQDVLKYWRTIIRSGLIGTAIGIIPGVGEDIAAWSSYAAARRVSKEKEMFGRGSIDGLMAAETGDNACVPGAIIPVLTLAVPGSAPAAVLMAAMLIHGVNPGPLIMVEAPQFVYDVVAMMLIATVGILIYGVSLTRLLVKVLQVPPTLVMPVIFVLCTVGSYAIASRLFDVYVMLAFGVVGFVLRQLNFPMAPLVLGIVLGDLMEKSLRRGLVLSDGDLAPFFTRPVSFAMFALIAGTILLNVPAFHRGATRAWASALAAFGRKGQGSGS
jgi:putative tricarboxylic transport membrane protein